LIEAAKELVASLRRDNQNVIGAYIDGSVAWDEMTPVSDVDIAVIEANRTKSSRVFRRMVLGTVMEWVLMPDKEVRDIEAILSHAGRVHMIRKALILLDVEGLLEEARDKIRQRYQEPQGILRRAENQQAVVEFSIKAMESCLDKKDVIGAQLSHTGIIQFLLGLPRALTNQRCTMAQAFPFCRESAKVLGQPDYIVRITDLLGATSLDRNSVMRLNDLATALIEASGLEPEETAARLHKLMAAPWLLDQGPPGDAVWPLYVWTRLTAEEVIRKGDATSDVRELWSLFIEPLNVADIQDISQKLDCAKDLLETAQDMIEASRARFFVQ